MFPQQMDFLSKSTPPANKQLQRLNQRSLRHMARRNTWSAKQGAIKEVADDEEYISSNDIRKSIVLSMSAGDEDWSNYRRRSSGGNAVQAFQQNRSRRSSREDTVIGSSEQQSDHRSTDSNGNYEQSDLQEDQDKSDKSCEDFLKFVTQELNKLEMENNTTVTDERRRRFGQVSRKPNLKTPNDSGRLYSTSTDALTRLYSDPAYGDEGIRSPLAKSLSADIAKSYSMAQRDAEYDISGQTSESRFPWLKDQGVQCDLNVDMTTNQRVIDLPEKPKSRPFSALVEPTSQESTPRSNRSYSHSAIFNNNEKLPFTKHLRQLSTDAATFQDGKVVMEPAVLQESLEFYVQAAMDTDEGDPMQKFNRGRRSCVVSALELGDSETQPAEESNDSQTYPGDLVLYNGQALRQSSPTTINGDSADHYGSEGSLAQESHSPTTQPKDDKKPLKSKNSFFKVGPWKGKKTTQDVEYVLMNMKATEFRDEQIASSRQSHWQSLLTNPEQIANISDKERTRRDAAWEIFTNECTFLVDHLMVLKHCFMEPLKKCQVEGLLMEVEPIKLFGNLDELCDLSYKFCRNFHSALKSTPPSDFASTECLCKCLDEMTLNSRDGDIYHSYLLNYRSALTYLDILRNTLEDYAAFERHCEQDSRCNKLRLSDLLVAPMQHWTRLPLLLQRVRKYTSGQSELDSLDESTDKVVSSLKSLENKMEWLKTFERVREIEKQLIWPTIFEIDSKTFIPEQLRGLLGVQPTEKLLDDKIREITFEGPLMLMEKTGHVDTHVFLFTDFLLFTKLKKDVKRSRGRMSTIEKNEGFYHVLKQPIPVESLSIHDIGTAEASAAGMKNLFVIVQRNSFQQVVGVFTLQAHTPLGKKNWLTHLRDNKEKTTEINNNKAELSSRQRSFRDDQDNGSHSSLLKGVINSQVLELTNSMSATLPRRSQTCSHKMGLSLPQNKLKSDENLSAVNPGKPHLMHDKTRTKSTGCLHNDHSLSLINGSYIH